MGSSTALAPSEAEARRAGPGAEKVALRDGLAGAFARLQNAGAWRPPVPGSDVLGGLAAELLTARNKPEQTWLEDKSRNEGGLSRRLHVLSPGLAAVWLKQPALGSGASKHVKPALLVDLRTPGSPKVLEVAKVVAKVDPRNGKHFDATKLEIKKQISIVDGRVVPSVDVYGYSLIRGRTQDKGMKLVSYQELCQKDLLDLSFPDGLPLDPTRLAFGVAALEALSALHGQGKAHNDIKLENFLLSRDGGVRLTDFALASDNLSSPSPGGTIGYRSAAAYVAGRDPTATIPRIRQREDVYAMGCSLYRLLTALEPPHAYAYSYELLRFKSARVPLNDSQRMWLYERLSPPFGTREAARTSLDLGVSPPDALEALVWSLMDPDPQRRPTAKDARDALRRLLDAPNVEQQCGTFRAAADELTHAPSWQDRRPAWSALESA